MNWQSIKNITHVEIGRFLALMLVAWSPFMGGPRLPSLLLALMGLWLVVMRRQTLIDNPSLRRWAWVFGLLWIPMVLATPNAIEWQRSAGIAGMMLAYFLVGIALMQVLRADKDRRWLVKWITIVLLVWLVDALIQYFFGRDLLGIPRSPDGRVVGVFEGDLRLSLFLAVLLPLLLHQVLTTRWLGKTRWLWAFTVFVATSIIVVLGGSRGALLMVVVAVIGVFWRFPLRYKIVLSVVLLFTLAATIGLSPVMKERMQRFDMTDGINFKTMDTLLSGRMTIWETAFNMLKDRPLTGVGVGGFADAYDHYSTRPDDPFRKGGNYTGGVYHAHQLYISIAAETGLIGFAGIISIYLLCLVWYFRAPPERREQALPFAFSLFVASFPINSQPVLFTHWWFPLNLLLLCGMLAALGGGNITEKKTSELVR